MKYIVIEGNIGVGKTTLATKLATDFKAKFLPEQFDANPFLPKFYKNPERYSFQLELSFLVERYYQIKNEVTSSEKSGALIISDYCFTKSAIFAKNTLPNEEFTIFRDIYDNFLEQIPSPDLYVYLHADVKKLKENIRSRGREYEKEINIEYLFKIEQSYRNYIDKISKFPVLFADINDIDFVSEPENYDNLKKAIFNSDYKLGINRLVIRQKID